MKLYRKPYESRPKGRIICFLLVCCFGIFMLAISPIAFGHPVKPVSTNLLLQTKSDTHISIQDTAFPEIIDNLYKSLSVYQETHREGKATEVLKDLAIIHFHQGNLDSAEHELQQVLSYYKAHNTRELPPVYNLLAAVSTSQGNFRQALFYAVEAIKSMEHTGDTSLAGFYYVRIAHVYRELGQTEKSMGWYFKGLEFFKKNHGNALPNPLFNSFYNPGHQPLYRIAWHLTRDLIRQHKEKEALALMLEIVNQYPTNEIADKENIAGALAECYQANQQFDRAEACFLEMIAWEEKLNTGNIFSSDAYYLTGKFYIDRQQYAQAKKYLPIALQMAGNVPLSRVKDIHLMLFKVDSAQGEYLSAIRYFEKYKILNDSLFNEARSRQIEELQIQYEIAKKEQDIQLLNERAQLQQATITKANLTRNITFGGVAVLLLIVGLLFNRYRLKQYSNRQLRIQQEEINIKNQSLRKLVSEQHQLLADKEWLLKEIHHRVKNNLQLVMSLLNTQTAYVNNKDALEVIRDSQHRMQTISLVHQKLYQSETVGLVNMKVYISELTDYLQESFNTGKYLRFDLQIASIELDVLQAIPLGLILNEAISNAIKYAFPGNTEGKVTISFNETNKHQYQLIIIDNGVGLPAGLDVQNSNSLGMNLMNGLSKQLEGTFSVESKKGIKLQISFPKQKSVDTEFTAVRCDKTYYHG